MGKQAKALLFPLRPQLLKVDWTKQVHNRKMTCSTSTRMRDVCQWRSQTQKSSRPLGYCNTNLSCILNKQAIFI